MICKLIRPHIDKNWSYQILGCDKKVRDKVVSVFSDIKYAQPFLQGDSGNWLMVEFWTNNKTHILEACNFISESLGINYCESDDFTQEDLLNCKI